MKKLSCISLMFFSLSIIAQNNLNDSLQIRKIYTEALSNSPVYEQLRFLCKNIGHRLSGSPRAAKAVTWSEKEMKKIAENVIMQEVMVPHWVRGEKEKAKLIIDGKPIQNIEILALGGSVGTPKQGITAEIIAVDSLSHLKKLGDKVKGKIVFFRRPMNPTIISTFNAYGDAGDQRYDGPSEAAKYGAIGAIVRSLGLAADNYPHTGMLFYNPDVPKIPAAAISTNTANMFDKLLAQKKKLSFQMILNSETLPDEKSYNVIGEIKGTEFPEEIIVVGGHLDSWDVGEGAHDDGTGCVQSMEVLRIFKSLGIKPKRTIRAVMFMNEENGVKGGEKYAELAKKNGEKTIAAIESDAGGHTPRGFSFQDSPAKFLKWMPYFEPYGIKQFDKGYGGTDIHPLEDQGTVLIGFMPDSQRYFDYHHTNNDVFENVNKRELEMGAATMASLVYLLSEYGVK